MRPTFVIADLHMGDFDMCNLKKADGHPLRPFSTIEEHDETIIANWNKVVPKDARVYVLGDVFLLQFTHALDFVKVHYEAGVI